MLYKNTIKLFRGKYQYKVVLVCSAAHCFRSGDIQSAIDALVGRSSKSHKEVAKVAYALELAEAMSKMADFEVRIESPWVSIYTNSKVDVDTLTKIDQNSVKYVCQPADNANLAVGTIIMPKMNYEYRVTLGKTNQEHSAFIAWADSNKKCKLTKSCIRDLCSTRTWGGTHFYITGDNNLLLARMHLGECIAKVERIVKN